MNIQKFFMGLIDHGWIKRIRLKLIRSGEEIMKNTLKLTVIRKANLMVSCLLYNYEILKINIYVDEVG